MRMSLFPVFAVLAAILHQTEGLKYSVRCKWPNEGCSSHAACCSGKCIQKHPGTNHRCVKSQMRGPCLYSHHCGHRMMCGLDNRCCASFWEDCSSDVECCSPAHRCQRMKGFIYKKCVQARSVMPMAGVARLHNIAAVAVLTSVSVLLSTFMCL